MYSVGWPPGMEVGRSICPQKCVVGQALARIPRFIGSPHGVEQKHGKWGKQVMEAIDDLFEEFSDAVAIVVREAQKK